MYFRFKKGSQAWRRALQSSRVDRYVINFSKAILEQMNLENDVKLAIFSKCVWKQMRVIWPSMFFPLLIIKIITLENN